MSYLRITRAAGAIVAAVVTCLIGASASPAAADPAPPPAGSAPFAVQARAAGLTTAQAQQLQAQVDKEVARTGGTQIAANQVLQPGGRGDVLIPLPGERFARELTVDGSAVAVPAWHAPVYNCYYGQFCLYANSDYSGMVNRWSSCYTEPVEHFFSAYVNNQTEGTKAEFLGLDKEHLTWTKVAFGMAVTDRWWTTYYVDPC